MDNSKHFGFAMITILLAFTIINVYISSTPTCICKFPNVINYGIIE